MYSLQVPFNAFADSMLASPGKTLPLCGRTGDTLNTFRMRNLADTLSTIVKMGYKPGKEVLDALAAQVYDQLHEECTPQDLVRLSCLPHEVYPAPPWAIFKNLLKIVLGESCSMQAKIALA